MRVSITTWNMDYWKRNKEQREAAWDYLIQTIAPDIALVQEFSPPVKQDACFNILYREIGGTRRWGSAIITRGLSVQEVQFNNNYPGAVVAADVMLPNGWLLTAISLYGLIDDNGYATTTLHRMLSDLTPLLHRRTGRRDFVVGGDYNVSTQWDEHYGYKDPSHRIFFERLEDFGLINCTARFHGGHVQTNRHPRSSVPWQNDYIHVSAEVANRLVSCDVVDDPVIWELSDHNPVVAIIDV